MAVKVFTHTNKELVKLAAAQRTPNRQGSKHKHTFTLVVTQCRYQKTCKCDTVWKQSLQSLSIHNSDFSVFVSAAQNGMWHL